MKSSEYCPDCIVELISIKHKVGMRTNWMKCPNCGFKKYSESEINIEKQGIFIDRIRRANKNENDYNKDTE